MVRTCLSPRPVCASPVRASASRNLRSEPGSQPRALVVEVFEGRATMGDGAAELEEQGWSRCSWS
ncbi:hypothetical protein FM106_12195 [Brachybacterium faecium]|nr:hypothetical protein FM106_12195 [Brachybacterium faecium]